MRLATLKSRRLVIVAIMALAIISLTFPVNRTADASTVVADFCADCAQQCWNDANTGENNVAYWECVDDAGDTPANRDACYNTVVIGYYNGCIAMFCNTTGCKVVRKAPYTRPGDN